ncbi:MULTISPECIES: hypothetical protein [unclassified Micromonospora]|uniref:hypothetical protein n=1 Tax=unclassified Micromonospora TaxID=2617518 RepID=UPI001034350A|nr:hypothetical protein [Verrucosispora sp. SN26_14.1]TBL45040.1 hypothetical protein EYA84_01085 [Verrucosispora sp. SN26_14.1]
MGDGDAADPGDLGGPDFAPVVPVVQSSAFGAPPEHRATIILGPGYHGYAVLTRTPPQPDPDPDPPA